MPLYVDFNRISDIDPDRHAYFFTKPFGHGCAGALYDSWDLAAVENSRENFLSARCVLTSGHYFDINRGCRTEMQHGRGNEWNPAWDDLLRDQGVVDAWILNPRAITAYQGSTWEIFHLDWKEDGPITDTLGNSGNLYVYTSGYCSIIMQNNSRYRCHGYHGLDKTVAVNSMNNWLNRLQRCGAPLF